MQTKISFPFIEALEAAELDKLPEEVFARGFIRNLSKVYELDEKELLLLFDGAVEEDVVEKKTSQVRDNRRARRRKKMGVKKVKKNFAKARPQFFKPTPLVLLAVGVLIGVGLIFWGVSQKKQEPKLMKFQASSSKTTPKPEGLVKTKPEVQETEKIVTNLSAKPAPEETTEAVDTSAQVVEVKVLSKVRLRVSKDGGASVTETLMPDSYKYRFQEELAMFIYDSSAVEVSFNGESLGRIGAKGEMSRLAFKSDKFDLSKQAQ